MALSTTMGRRVVAALTDLNPHLALLIAEPAELQDPTSSDILAVECTMTGYERIYLDSWTQDLSARPPFSYNLSAAAMSGPVAAPSQTITHMALVQNGSGATGEIYAIQPLATPRPLDPDTIITIAAGDIKVIAI